MLIVVFQVQRVPVLRLVSQLVLQDGLAFFLGAAKPSGWVAVYVQAIYGVDHAETRCDYTPLVPMEKMWEIDVFSKQPFKSVHQGRAEITATAKEFAKDVDATIPARECQEDFLELPG